MYRKKIAAALSLFFSFLLLASCTSSQTAYKQWKVNAALYEGGKFSAYTAWTVDLPGDWKLKDGETNAPYFQTELGDFHLAFSSDTLEEDLLESPYYFNYEKTEKIPLLSGTVYYMKSGEENTFLYQATDAIVAEIFFTKAGSFDLKQAKTALEPVISSLTLEETLTGEEGEARYATLPAYELLGETA